jgi:2'-5' RNA ligase
MRCFVGLVPDRPALEALRRCGEFVRAADAVWARKRWTPRQNLHITLAFLGDVGTDSVDEIVDGLSVAIRARGGLSFGFDGLLARPGAADASMLWADIADDAGIADLALGIRGQLDRSGHLIDRRPFHGHVTLVRARHASRAPKCLSEAFAFSRLGDITVSDPAVTLFSSELTAQGPVYRTIATWPSPSASE